MLEQHIALIRDSASFQDKVLSTIAFVTDYVHRQIPGPAMMLILFLPSVPLLLVSLTQVFHPLYRSFVILNEFTKNERDKYHRRSGRLKKIVAAIIVGVGTSIAGAIIMSY